MPDYLFVYGTLRRELVKRVSPELQALMHSLLFIGEGQIQGELYNLGEYPGAIVGAEFKTKIIGEVYELLEPEQTLEMLDVFEGFIPDELEASLYARTKEAISLTDGRQLACWMYVYNDWVSTGSLIQSGDYVEYFLTQNANESFA